MTIDAMREYVRLNSLNIRYGNATVPYKGFDMWVALGGKMLHGHDQAVEYAKKLNKLMTPG